MSHRPSQPSPAAAMSRVVRLALFGAALAQPIAYAPLARAQIFTGVEPSQPLVIPRAVPPATSVPAAEPALSAIATETQPPTLTEARDAPRAPATDAPRLRHLPNTLEGFRLTGETGTLRWPIYLTRAQAEGKARFRLGYLSAISVLEDASSLTLTVNGHVVGATPVAASRVAATTDFDIPPGLLVHGYNAIAIILKQRHRVDCSVAATYELWTKIDPAMTGLLVDGARGFDDVSDIPALAPEADGTLPIRVVLASKMNPDQVQRLLVAVQRIAITGRFLQPAVDFGPLSDDPHGVNLVLGQRAILAKLPGIADAIGSSGPLARFVDLGLPGRPTLVVTGSTQQELDAAIARLGDIDAIAGAPEGLRLAKTYPGLATAGDTHLTLRDFDIASQEFGGRLFRQSFDLVLPADFLAADYARGTFDLAGGYAAGLTRDARVRVDVNGRNAGQVNLPRSGGDVFRHNQMFLPLSLMRPGLNRFDIVAETATPADATCDTSLPETTAKRFLLLDTSEITLPRLARVERLPDLALLAAGGLPFRGEHPRLFVPNPDRDTMAAALSFVARAAVAAGSVIPFDFTVTRPMDDTASILIVAPARALDPTLMARAGLDPTAVEAAWRDRATPPPVDAAVTPAERQWWSEDNGGPAACRLPGARLVGAKAEGVAPETAATKAEGVAPAPTPAVIVPPRVGDDDDLFDRWTETVHGSFSWRDAIGSWPARAIASARGVTDRLTWPSGAPAPRAPLDRQASLVVAQGMSGDRDGHVTTILTAPDAATLKASVACLEDPRVWTRLRGRLGALDASTGVIGSIEAEHLHYASSEPLSLGNARLVLAGWFSLNPMAFVIIALMTAACLSGTTLLFVRGIGRRNVKK